MARTTGAATDLITFTRASTGTFLGSNGFLQTAAINTPRVEYDANGVAKGLLIEEARTNELPYSQKFTTGWSIANCAEELNAAIAPDGTLSASKATPNGNSGDHGFYKSFTAGVDRVASVFAKQASGTYKLAIAPTGANNGPIFNLQTGEIDANTSPETATITPVGNGWYRCTVTVDSTSSYVKFYIADASNNWGYSGDGTSGIYLWGTQLEQGSFPTSYIPTSGATATRSADIASVSVSEFGYNQAQGSVVVEANPILSGSPIGLQGIIDFNNGTFNDQITIMNENNDRLRMIIDPTGTTNDVDFTISGAEGSEKYAAAWATNNVQAAHGGLLGAGDTSSNPPATITTLTIGNDAGSTVPLNGHIKSINYYPLRLSDAKLQELTS